jgi:serine/threonine protein kinase
MDYRKFSQRFRKKSAEPLGNGVFGRVYLGRDQELGRDIALKQTTDLNMAQREFTIMNSYGIHPNLPEVYAFAEDSGVAYIAMQLIKGKQLGNYLFGPKYSEEFTLQVLINLLKGVGRLNERGYLHLDIHPENILMENDLPDSVNLVDFGVAEKKAENGFWSGVTRGGTWEYFPPEQGDVEEKSIVTLDDTADTYSVAGVGLYLLTGQAPVLPDFTKFGNPLELGESTREYREECLRLKEKFPSRTPENDLERILFKGMSLSKEERYKSAAEFRAALEQE